MEASRTQAADERSRRPSLRLVVPPKAAYARYVRERVAGFVTAHAIPDADAGDFLTALGEAVANAIEHAQTVDKIEASCWVVGGDQLVATVVDSGVGFCARERLRAETEPPEPFAERGRGLAMMRQFTDHLEVRSEPGRGTAVILTRFVRHRHLAAVPDRPPAG